MQELGDDASVRVIVVTDNRVAADTASFGVTSARIGTVAGMGGTQRLPRLIGPGRAKEVLFSAESIDAAEAFRLGIVNRVVPAAQEVEAFTTEDRAEGLRAFHEKRAAKVQGR